MGSHRAHTAKIAAEAAKRREEFLDLVATTGMNYKDACVKYGIHYGTYCTWRNKNPEWAARLDLAKAAFRQQGRGFDGTFLSFRQSFLRMQTTWFQKLIADAIEGARPGEVTLVLIPPEHGKTTLLEDWCTYKLCTDPSFRITVASETVDHGIKIIDRVRSRLELGGPTPLIPQEFGPLEPENKADTQVWGQRHFNVAQKRSSDERDYSMNCVGITGRVQGTRCDLMLLDDIQDVKSIEQSQKYFDIIVQSFLSRPSMFGRTVIIGTRVGEYDVYRKLIDANIPDRTIRIPAYDKWKSPPWPKPEAKPDIDKPETWAPEGMAFLWPEMYDQEEKNGLYVKGLHRYRYAALRYRVGEQTWWRVYMQKPEAASSMTFDIETTKAMRDETRSVIAEPRPIGHLEDPLLEGAETRPVPIIIGVDPAVGGGNGVLSVAARPHKMEVLSAHLDYGLTKYSQIIELIEEDCHRYSSPNSVVSTVVIEDKAFQKGLLQDDKMIELQKRFGFRIIPNTTGREKADKDIGVPAMPMAMVREQITIPWSDDKSRKEMFHLLEQLHSWRPGVNGVKLPQDLVMALWFCYRQWRAIRMQPVSSDFQLDNWRSQHSPIRRSRPRTISRKPSYRSVRGRGA